MYHLEGDGEYAVSVRGESHHEKALDSLLADHRAKGPKRAVALLVLENENAYDLKAVRVEIEGKLVGYLAQKVARVHRAAIKALGHADEDVSCNVEIGKRHSVRLDLGKKWQEADEDDE